ncbi:MAG: glycosyltransferase [Alphaproteobacteria bacterium]|nr:glycosyltransferase [Alphaproteobacteria bacterium]
MKLFGKRHHNGKTKYYFLGLPFLAKKRTAVAVRTYLFGIRISKRQLSAVAPYIDSSVPKQSARARYILRAHANRFIGKDYRSENKKITVLVQACLIQVAHDRGVGVYALGLLEAMVATGKVKIDFLYDRNQRPLWHENKFCKNHNAVFFEQLDDPDSEVYDFYFDPHLWHSYYKDNIAGSLQRMSSAKYMVGILHDITPPIFWGSHSKNWYLQAFAENSLCNIFFADHIFTNSKCTAIDAINNLDIPREKFTVVYGGADTSRFRRSDKVKLNNDLVAILGGDPRKNVDGAIIAFIKAYESGKIPKDARIVIASFLENRHKDVIDKIKGRLRESAPNFKLDGRVVLFDKYRPSDKEVGDMLHACRATIFPSFYEGLGLPVLESYAIGKPCIASNNSSVAEITAPECQFNPFDADDIAKKIIGIYTNPELAKKSLKFGKELLAETCNWDAVAAKVVSKMEEMIKRREV